MEFKVGDKVKVLNTEFGNKDKIGTITNISGSTMIYFVEIEGDCGHVCQWSNASDLELVTEEEKVMKFKVGDKVKVSNSWDGHDGEIGEIVAINVYNEFTHEVRFEDMCSEHFREEELELVKEKDNYPLLKQAYKSLLEIQKELTTLEESMMRTVRHTRTEIARNEEELAELESKILEAAKQ